MHLKVHNTKNVIGVLKFCVDFIVQFLGYAGIGINQDLQKGEVIFSIMNKDKYFAVVQLLTSLSAFFEKLLFINSMPVKTIDRTIRFSSPSSFFWCSAKPLIEENVSSVHFVQQQARAQVSLRVSALLVPSVAIQQIQ